jgi:hypothetical protein
MLDLEQTILAIVFSRRRHRRRVCTWFYPMSSYWHSMFGPGFHNVRTCTVKKSGPLTSCYIECFHTLVNHKQLVMFGIVCSAAFSLGLGLGLGLG